MLKVAVCDDNEIFLKEVKAVLSELNQIDETYYYASPQDLLNDIVGEQISPNLLLMDIQFGETKNGLNYAEELLHIAPELGVICVTGYNDRYAQHVLLHNINLIGYLTKPLDKELLVSYLNKALEKYRSPAFLQFTSHGKSYSISADSIFYIESRNHTLHLHTEKTCYEFYDKLSRLEPNLPTLFAQCHKSFLVNMSHVSGIEPSDLTLSNGEKIPISKNYQSKIQKAFFHYIGQNI